MCVMSAKCLVYLALTIILQGNRSETTELLNVVLLESQNEPGTNVQCLESALFTWTCQAWKIVSTEIDVRHPFSLVSTQVSSMMERAYAILTPSFMCSFLHYQMRHFSLTTDVVCFDVDTNGTTGEACDITFHLPETYIYTVLKPLLIKLNWDSLIILSDEEHEMASKIILDESWAVGVKTLVFIIPSNATDEQLLHLMLKSTSIDPTAAWNFLILCNTLCLQRILKQVNRFDNWMQKTTDFRSSSYWLMLLPKEDMFMVEAVGGWVDNIAVISAPTPIAGCLFEAYKGSSECWSGEIHSLMYRGSVRNLDVVCQYNRGDIKLCSSKSQIFPNYNQGFNGRPFIVATNVWYPFVMKQGNNQTSTYEGFCIDLLFEMAGALNFTYKLIEPPDGEWGTNTNGQYSGLIGQLQRKDVDMVVAPISMSHDREKVMDSTYPFYNDVGTGVYRIPDSSVKEWLILSLPFSWVVHVFIACAFVFSVGLVHFLHRCQKDEVEGSIDFSADALRVFGIFLRQGLNIKLRSSSTAIFVGLLCLFATIISAVYSGNLIAFLTVAKETKPFNTIPEVADQTDYTWGIHGGTLWVNVFQSSTNPSFMKIWDSILKSNLSDPGVLHISADYHKARMEAGGYVFFTESDIGSIWATQNCDVRLLKDYFYRIQYAIGLPQNSPYGELVSDIVLKFHESGLMGAWKQKWWPKGSNCSFTQVVHKPIEISQLQSAFYVLLVGISLAFTTMCLECMVRIIRLQREDSK
ncbi:glutamate receptor ionotropic, kainate glr-3-like [Haliotis cracherodii]|uniref:glutamate receptor ionotropic, kainate glr-3-like n=1 Tax=Haliotis cracherodii TaxID=6455 RepID=UPI0039EA3627